MIRKVGCLWMLIFVLVAFADAQQKPHYTQYLTNQYILNPAITGIENYTDIRISHRHQWIGIADAPVTTYFTIHKAIGKWDTRSTATSFDVPDESPRSKEYWRQYVAAEPHHGIGLQVINDRTGPLNRFTAMATYAYHIGISSRTSLSAGIAAGLTNISLKTDKLEWDVPVDPAVFGTGILNRFRPDINVGLYLYSADYFLGLSVQQIYPQKINFSDGSINAEGKSVPHFFAHAGWRFNLTDEWNFIPSVLVKKVSPLPVQFDLNGRFMYRNLFWFGGGYRTDDGLSAHAGMHIAQSVSFAYSYDYNFSKLYNYSRGTHEVQLGFQIGSKYYQGCPQNVW